MKKTLAYLAAFAFAIGMASSSYAQTIGTPTGNVPHPQTTTVQTAGEHESKERHPHIHRAIGALENAKKALQEGQHDFGGHREKALDHVEAALRECQEALSYDKK